MYRVSSPVKRPPNSALFPLRVSGDGRSINTAGGQEFTFNGVAPWSLIANVSKADVPFFLANLQAKQVNGIMVNLIEHKFTEQTPKYRNKLGQDPFTGTVSAGVPDFTTPNEAYWQHVDYVVQQARAFGIVVLAFPSYMGFGQGDEGWATEIQTNTTTRMATYGTFLGNRYKEQPNIIWAMGGDSPPTGPVGDLTAHVNALANAIKAVSPKHLMTAHSVVTHSSFDDYNQPWVDLNAAYATVNVVHIEVRTAWQQVAKPTFLIEGAYGNQDSLILDDSLRAQMYQAILGGGVGHFYGQNPMWYFGVDAAASGNSFALTGGLDWHTQLDAFAASSLPFVRRLQRARPLSTLTPDYAHLKIPSGYDPNGNEDSQYKAARANNQMLVAYNRGSVSGSITIAKSQFLPGTYNVGWYNPRTGAVVPDAPVTLGVAGTSTLTVPDGNDWVLLLDDQALGLGVP